MLVDAGEVTSATTLLAEVREALESNCSPLVRSWLIAAHGETLASNFDRAQSLRAFDQSIELLPADVANDDGPYVALDSTHLARWRGNALAQLADPDAVKVLVSALERLDSTFTRAETALRTDLMIALNSINQHEEAIIHGKRALHLALQIGSVRQEHRLRSQRSDARAMGANSYRDTTKAQSVND